MPLTCKPVTVKRQQNIFREKTIVIRDNFLEKNRGLVDSEFLKICLELDNALDKLKSYG